MRTPWPSRSAPHHWIASQIDGSPNASPAWMVKWTFSRSQVLERVEVPGRRVARPRRRRCRSRRRPGRGSRTASSAISRRARGVPHRGQQAPHPDRAARGRGGLLALGEPGQDRVDHLVQRQPRLEVLLGGVADLGVDHAVGGQVVDALAGHPVQRRRRSASPPTVCANGLQVALQRAASARAVAEPGRQRRRRRRRAGRRSPICVGELAARSPGAARRRGGRAAAPWAPARSMSRVSGRRHGTIRSITSATALDDELAGDGDRRRSSRRPVRAAPPRTAPGCRCAG